MPQFYVLLILDSLILQPIRIVLGFIMRFLWHPPRAQDVSADRSRAQVYARAQELIPTLNRNTYGQGGDSAKFLGMLYYATRKLEDWKNVMALVCDDGSLKRNLKDPYPKDSVPFSSDMLSGFMLAVAAHLPVISDEDRKRLAKVWELTTWKGWPLLTSDPSYGKKPFNRGHVWRPWWVIGSEEVLSAMAWLRIGYDLTGKTRYLVGYWAFLVLQIPSLIFGCTDAQIWLGPFYYTAAHNTHSKALVFHTGWSLTGSMWFSFALNKSYRRHGSYCVDITLLGGDHADDDNYLEHAHALLCSTIKKGSHACPEDTRYISLGLPPEVVMRAPMLMAPEYRGADYVGERSAIKGQFLDDGYRQSMGLDTIFPAALLKERDPDFDH